MNDIVLGTSGDDSTITGRLFMHRAKHVGVIERLEGRRLFSCSDFGQAIATNARDDDGNPPVVEVAHENPGPAMGIAVSGAASDCAANT